MPTSALLLALTAAFVHALWNVLLARARDTQAATAVALLTAEVVFAVPTWAAWRVERAVWPCVIAAYTLVDKRGVSHAGALPYLELSMLGPALVYAAFVARARGGHALRSELRASTFVAGVATFGAYCLVLLALQRAAAAPVAAV